MPTRSNIPLSVKKIGAVVSGRFAVFGRLTEVGVVFVKLEKLDELGKAFPAVGYIRHKGKRLYYCRVGLVNDPDIYAKR